MQEHTRRYALKTEGSSDRSFGLVFGAIFAVIAAYPLLDGGSVRTWSLATACLFVAAALFLPQVLAPANRLWMRFGLLLHRVVSPAALGLVFCLAVLPVGLLMRLLRKDPLRLKADPAAESYWIRRDPPGPTADSFNNQF